MTLTAGCDIGAQMSTQIGAHLRRVPLFAGLDEAALSVLAARCRRRRFPAKEALFHEGDPGQTLYIVLSGRIAIERVSAAGETIHLAGRGPGDTVGELSLLDGKPRSGDAVTETACDLLMLDRSEFLRSVESAPRIGLNVITCLSARLREASDERAGDRSRDVMGRLCAFLLSKEMSADCGSGGAGRPDPPLSQRQIAERIGATRESVNRTMKRLKDTGVVSRSEDGRIVVLNASKLRRLCRD